MTEPGTNRQWRTVVKERDARISELEAENERLRRTVAEYENCITWDTTCKQCAHTLDASIREYERADKAEARLAKVRGLLEHAKNVSPSASMTVYVTDVEAALEGKR